MKQQQAAQPQPPQPPMPQQGQAPMPGAPPVPNVADPTGSGGGNIGVGQVPVPGEQGFAGNEQQHQAAAPVPPQA